MILFPFFSSFFPPFSRGGRGFCSGVGAQSSTKHGGERVLRFFSLQTRGGTRYVRHICAKHGGEKVFSAPFLAVFLGLLFLFCFFFEGWASEKEAAEATRAEELGSEEAEEQG